LHLFDINLSGLQMGITNTYQKIRDEIN
jgi:hypothetical protein